MPMKPSLKMYEPPTDSPSLCGDEFGCVPLNGRGSGSEQVGVARHAIVVAPCGRRRRHGSRNCRRRHRAARRLQGRCRRWCRAAQFRLAQVRCACQPRIVRQRRNRVRDAVVGGADHAADRLRAVAQRRRSADHLDLVGGQRIDRHEMIFAEIGHAAAADAVLDDADAVDIEAADDRAGSTRPARSSIR